MEPLRIPFFLSLEDTCSEQNGDHKERQEDKEQYLGNISCPLRYATKSEDGGDNGDYKKDY
jgi:hypothetical protein